MALKLTDAVVADLPAPASGNKVTYDEVVKGFGVRVTAAGAKAFVLNYRAGGRERRYTIGSHPDWKTAEARNEAKDLKKRVDRGEDPMGERHEERAAPTIATLADRFEAEHLAKRRPSTVRDYKGILANHIRPELGKVRVAELRHADVEALHRKIAAKAPYRANRVVAVLSKMLSLAVKWEMRGDNPVKGVERAPEEKRERFLSPAEVGRLAAALAAHPEKVSANALRLLLLTGARKGETLAAQWSEFDLAAGVWTKPSHHTKTAKLHRVPLSAPAVMLLTEMQTEADPGCPLVFPGKRTKDAEGRAVWQPLTEIRKAWLAVCRDAGMAVAVPVKDAAGKPVFDAKGQPVVEWKATARVHDLRHSYASMLASSGLSLPIIGALLGHTQAATTQRYAHLMDDPLRAATERVGAIVGSAGKPVAQVVRIGGGRG